MLLILDENSIGFGRLQATHVSARTSCIEADLRTTAKGIAGGIPLAAVVVKQDIMDAPIQAGLVGRMAVLLSLCGRPAVICT